MESLTCILNYRRAALAAGTGAFALLIVGGTLATIIAVGYLLAAKYLLGGGPPYAELLALIALPSAVSASGVLLTRALGGRGLRTWISAAVGFILAINVVLEELENTSSPGDEGRTLAIMFLLVSSLSVLIATVHRTDISRSRAGIIIALVIVFVAIGFAGTTMVPLASVRASVLIAGGFTWIVLPALAALFIPFSNETQTSEDRVP